MSEVFCGYTFLARGAGHPWDAGFDEIRALEEENDEVGIDEKWTDNMQFGCAASESAGEVPKDSRFSILETWSDFR